MSGNVPSFMQQDYDFEEGVKRYTKRIYSEMIDLVQSILPEQVEEREEKNTHPEEIKGYHAK